VISCAELPKGTTYAEIIVVHGSKNRESLRRVPDLRQQMQRAKNYWRKETPIPRNKIFVPDSGIQYLLETNARNLYQVREIVDGYLQFQPGPTVYRGLWSVDVMLSGIPVMMLGDTSSMRRFLENDIRYQLPNGQLHTMYPTLSLIETPVFVYTMYWFRRAPEIKCCEKLACGYEGNRLDTSNAGTDTCRSYGVLLRFDANRLCRRRH
jgi:hypothetical protein